MTFVDNQTEEESTDEGLIKINGNDFLRFTINMYHHFVDIYI